MRRLAILVSILAFVVLPATHVTAATVPTNVNVSQRVGNESEEAIAVNPTNRNNIVIVTNIAEGQTGLFKAVTFDGGATWTREIIADTEHNPADTSGIRAATRAGIRRVREPLLSYLYNVEINVPIALSSTAA